MSRRPKFLALNPNVLCKRLGFPFLCAAHNGAMHFYRSSSDDGLKSLATTKETIKKIGRLRSFTFRVRLKGVIMTV